MIAITAILPLEGADAADDQRAAIDGVISIMEQCHALHTVQLVCRDDNLTRSDTVEVILTAIARTRRPLMRQLILQMGLVSAVTVSADALAGALAASPNLDALSLSGLDIVGVPTLSPLELPAVRSICLCSVALAPAFARSLAPLITASTRDVIIRGVATPLQLELLRGVDGAMTGQAWAWILGEDVEDVYAAGASGHPIDHESVAAFEKATGGHALALRRAYATPLVFVAAHDAEALDLSGLGLVFDRATLADRLADLSFAPRLKLLILEGERDETLEERAVERKLTVVYRCVCAVERADE